MRNELDIAELEVWNREPQGDYTVPPVLIYTGSELFINHFLAEYIQSPLTRPSGQRDDSTAILYRYQKMMTLLATIQSKINYRYSKLCNSKNSITVIKKTFTYLENITL